jgi:hypothetical protein
MPLRTPKSSVSTGSAAIEKPNPVTLWTAEATTTTANGTAHAVTLGTDRLRRANWKAAPAATRVGCVVATVRA